MTGAGFNDPQAARQQVARRQGKLAGQRDHVIRELTEAVSERLFEMLKQVVQANRRSMPASSQSGLALNLGIVDDVLEQLKVAGAGNGDVAEHELPQSTHLRLQILDTLLDCFAQFTHSQSMTAPVAATARDSEDDAADHRQNGGEA